MRLFGIMLVTALAIGCGGSEAAPTPSAEAQATADVKATLQTQLDEWYAAVVALRDAAPTPSGRGWDATADADAIAEMRASWRRGRAAYERVEGAIAVLFPDLDRATDARYDDFLSEGPDDDLFDDSGVTGMHAIERVLFADAVPAAVVAFESKLPGYRAAAWPANEADAKRFKDALCAKLVADVGEMRARFTPLALDLGYALQGVIDLMNEQVEKVENAATGEEESRYAQTTLLDLRSNLAGNRAVYEAFRPWLRTRADGAAIDAQVVAGFARLEAAYAAEPGDAIPSPPSTWSSSAPSSADLATPFGKLWSAVKAEAEPEDPTSVVGALEAARASLGLEGAP